jgi:hypothetical protein
VHKAADASLVVAYLKLTLFKTDFLHSAFQLQEAIMKFSITSVFLALLVVIFAVQVSALGELHSMFLMLLSMQAKDKDIISVYLRREKESQTS